MDSRIKLIVSVFLIIAATSVKHWYLPVIILLLSAAATFKLGFMRDYAKKLFFPLVLSAFIVLIQSTTSGTGRIDMVIISVNAGGLEYGLLIFTRVLASASVFILLTQTTSQSELLGTLRWLRVPGTIIDISSLMSRYISTFSREGRKLRLAQKARCGFSKKMSYIEMMSSIASICGTLFVRAFSRSEEVYRAMLSRAWKPGSRWSEGTVAFNRNDLISGIGVSSMIAVSLIVDRLL